MAASDLGESCAAVGNRKDTGIESRYGGRFEARVYRREQAPAVCGSTCPILFMKVVTA